ncbi:twin-arginine translocation signal domain-containing protein [Prolixibacteraceae bacterium JC049]|nr:twin-arginine translocation signal domain-containing protein [Prolixibacteraceae bacterium JC049]
MSEKGLSRRNFLGKAALIGAAGVAGAQLLHSCKSNQPKSDVKLDLPPLLDKAPDGPVLKAGLIGCGGRGTGAALNFLDAGPNLQITALADVFDDKVKQCREKLKSRRGVEIADEKCFVGFDAYEKLIDSGVDMIIHATPPFFRPQHFDAAVKARKHVFMEKPVSVDPAGTRQIMATAKKAEALGLSVVTGTLFRHANDYISVYKQVKQGAIGELVSANSYYNTSAAWYRNPNADWTEMEYMLRDWMNWCWLSGDHIVEQNVHRIDNVMWFMGKHPVKAVGFGSRQRRKTGDQFDNFSVDFVFDNNVHYHNMCRQINGTARNVSDYIVGSNGSTNLANTIWNPDGTVRFEYEYPKNEKGESMRWPDPNPYVQEHIDWVTSIRKNMAYNTAIATAESTMAGIMGRISAYTGKEVTWEEVMNSDLRLGPKHMVFGKVDIPKEVPVPGVAAKS